MEEEGPLWLGHLESVRAAMRKGQEPNSSKKPAWGLVKLTEILRFSWTLSLVVSLKSMALLILMFWQILLWVNRKDNDLNKSQAKVTSNICKILNAKETRWNVIIIICIKSSILCLLFGVHGYIICLEVWRVFNLFCC